jgi:2-isopropylmalate synthase
MRRLAVFDTTLRDGDQAAGIAFDRLTKRRLAVLLADSGVDVIEAGFPLSSQHDFDACCDIISVLRDFPVKVAVICGASISDICNTAVILNSNCVLHITLPVSDIHISSFFGISRSAFLMKARALTSYASGLSAFVEIGAEDATRADVDFLCEYCDTVIDAGASVVNIADTVGVFVPSQIGLLVRGLRERVCGFRIGRAGLSIHCHNDCGLAVANTLSAIESGCNQVEVTVGGIGERAGNAALEEVIANVTLHPEIYGVSTGVKNSQLGLLVNQFYSAAGIIVGRMKPLVGWNVRAHASGIHQKGIEIFGANYLPACLNDFVCDNLDDNVQIYNYVPERVVLSRHSGRAGIRLFAAWLGVGQFDEDKIEQLLGRIKNSGVRFWGITEFLLLVKELKLLASDSICPISCAAYVECCTDMRCDVSILLSDGETVLGNGVDPESALLSAVSKKTAQNIKINKTELTSINGNYRIYAELLTTNNNSITAIERYGNHPNRLLFECILDVINKNNILIKL